MTKPTEFGIPLARHFLEVYAISHIDWVSDEQFWDSLDNVCDYLNETILKCEQVEHALGHMNIVDTRLENMALINVGDLEYLAKAASIIAACSLGKDFFVDSLENELIIKYCKKHGKFPPKRPLSY